MVYVSTSRLGRGGLTQFCINFLRNNSQQEVIFDQKKMKKSSRNGSGSHVPSDRPRDTDHLLVRPSNLAARTVSLVEHTLSKFGGDPCPVRRGLVAAMNCYVRKARCFLCRQRTEMTHHYRGRPAIVVPENKTGFFNTLASLFSWGRYKTSLPPQ